MDWRQFTMNLGALEADQVEQVFARHGALSITLSDGGDNPVLEPARGETPLWSDTRITGLFAADADLQSLRADLLQSFDLPDLPDDCIEELAERVWEREWLRDFQPMRFGRRLWVSPDDMPVADSDAIIVRLDPGLAFGTGTHETTALCLEWLDSLDLAGKRVLDIGCGSGILAIAALKLGAASADGYDIDPQAVSASRDNAIRNGVDEQLRVSTNPADFPGKYDVVLANILAGTLLELAEDIVERTVHGGRLALSGILSSQIDQISETYVRWITLDPAVLRDNWVLISGQRD